MVDEVFDLFAEMFAEQLGSSTTMRGKAPALLTWSGCAATPAGLLPWQSGGVTWVPAAPPVRRR